VTRRLNEKETEAQKSLLLRLRAELVGDIGQLERSALGANERAAIDSPADAGSDAFAQEFSLELLARDEATLGEVEDALAKIAQGTYGMCEECSEPITKARLEAMPHARNCVSCQRELEARG
jgi:DnaK suppressor protein